MRLGVDTQHGLDPEIEGYLADFKPRLPARLPARERRVESVASVAFFAVAVPLAAFGLRTEIELGRALVLVAAYALVSRIRFATGTGYTDPSQIVLVLLLFALPPGCVPLAVMAAMLVSHLPEYARGRRHFDRVALVPGDAWHAVGPALVFALAAVSQPAWSDWPIYLAALVAQFAVDLIVSALRERFALGVPLRLQPRLLGWVFLVDLLLAPAGLLAAFAADEQPWAALLILPPTLLLALFASERRQRLEHALELNRAYRGTSLLLSDVLEAEDEYTGTHSRGVVDLSLAVADELGLDGHRRRNVELGALLHDVGKIAIPREILHKPGPLTPDEWQIMKMHTVVGQRMLDRVGGVLGDVGRVVRASHEHWDGAGYPDGLDGDDVPLEAYVVSCCDALHAMTTDRPYRRARSTAMALNELHAHAGTQFHPNVVAALARVLAPPESTAT